MRMHFSRLVLVPGFMSLAGILSGCARYERVPDYETEACRTSPPEPSFAGARPHFVPSVRNSGDSLSGVVYLGEAPKPAYSRIFLSTNPPTEVMVDSLGRFTIWAPPGRYAIAIRTIGYRAVQDSVILPPPPFSDLVVTVDPRQRGLDGPCSGFAEVWVRKPWWKFW